MFNHCHHPMDCSIPGSPVHYLLEFAQIHVHWVSDAIQPSHPLLSPSHLALNPNIRVFSKESALHIRWPKYWSFSISPSKEYSGLISFRIDCLISLQSRGLSRVFSYTTVQKHQFSGVQLSLESSSHIHQVAKVLELQLQHQSFQWIFETDFL